MVRVCASMFNNFCLQFGFSIIIFILLRREKFLMNCLFELKAVFA